MKNIALLRGINVGGNRKVEMRKLKALFESIGCINVSTYINSGNVFFESGKSREDLHKKLGRALKKEFGFDIPLLIKTGEEIKMIADAVPKTWKNDSEQKTDVAYLFGEIDSEEIVDNLPVRREYINIRYTPGAVLWNVKRKDLNRSHLSKVAGHELYQSMTVRNVNTARYLADNIS